MHELHTLAWLKAFCMRYSFIVSRKARSGVIDTSTQHARPSGAVHRFFQQRGMCSASLEGADDPVAVQLDHAVAMS